MRQYRSLLRQVKAGPHVWTGRHGVSALVLRQALMSGQVDTGFQFCTLVKSLESTFNNATSPHVWTNRHDALVLSASEERGTSVWAKIYTVYPRTQQVVGGVPSPATLIKI